LNRKIFMPIGERLREERARLGMNQPQFAAIAGTTKQTLFSWESGKTAPDAGQIAALAHGGVDVLYVITGERGINSQTRALIDAKQARISRFVDAGMDLEQVRELEANYGSGPSPQRIKQVAALLAKLRAIEFEAVYTQVESITQLRSALELAHAKLNSPPEAQAALKAASRPQRTTPGQVKGRKKAA
jgi:transcriptional regulator with XRE-family HTH domain